MDQARDSHLDALRGFAALGVIVFHLYQIAKGGPLPISPWMTHFADVVGDAGVPLFFVLSGYLLTTLMPTYARHRRPLLSFYIKRFFRIAPLFYCVVGLWVAFHIVKHLPMFPPIELLANGLLVFNLWPPYADSVVFAGWTIGVEVLFYLIFPVIFALPRRLPMQLIYLAASLALAFAVVALIPYLPFDADTLERYGLRVFFRHLPLFLAGMFAARLVPTLAQRPSARGIGLGLMLAAVAIFASLVAGFAADSEFGFRTLQGSAAAIFFVGFCLRPPRFAVRATAFLGRISYSTYLLHGPVIILMGSAFIQIFALGLPPNVAYLAALAAALAVIIPVSWLSFRFVEEPGNRLARRLIARIDASGAKRAEPQPA